MKRYILGFGGLLCAVVLIGAGCAPEYDYSETDSPIEYESGEQKGTGQYINRTEGAANDVIIDGPVSSLTLGAAVQENGNVAFSWKAPEDLELPEQLRLIASPDEEPSLEGTYQWQQYPNTTTDAVWDEFPQEMTHVRLCLFDTEKETCIGYSNELTLSFE